MSSNLVGTLAGPLLRPPPGTPLTLPDAKAVAKPRRVAENWILLLLFISILGSPFVSIEPSPYEGLILVLAAGVIAVGLPMHIRHLPLIAIVFVWIVGGLLAVMPVFNDHEATVYYFISVYMGLSAVLFACLFSTDVMHRLAALKSAYILAATVVALVGSLAYFGLIPGADMLMENGRARATFKDPNVFGPFLILPLLLILMSFLRGKISLGYVVAWVILLLGLFLSFSRGAWSHFVLSALVMVALLFATERSAKMRTRLLVGVAASAIVVAAIVGFALTTKVVADMFAERASLVQYYDTGRSGRFAGQLVGLETIATHPNGLGPKQFALKRGADPHNVYVNGFLSYGWIGGLSYLLLVIATLQQGLWALRRRTPWQPFLIATYATFVGLVAEGFIIDTDHWRHFYLLAGLIWGLSIASAKAEDAGVEINQQS